MSRKISVFCNKSIEFVHPLDREITVKIRDHQFEVAPSWILDTAMFAMLQKEGSIKIIKNSEDVKSTELKGKIAKDELDKLDEGVKKPQITMPELSKKEEEGEKEFVAEDNNEDDVVEVEDDNEDKIANLDLEEATAKQLYKYCLMNNIEVEEKKSRKHYLEKIEEANVNK